VDSLRLAGIQKKSSQKNQNTGSGWIRKQNIKLLIQQQQN
jgi:hypothetical protein